jgi:hypothetical protein
MSALTRILFPLPDYRRTPWSLLRWWESRRLTYNVAVGGAGLVTLGFLVLFSVLPPGLPGPVFVWRGVVVYAVVANLGYCLGWAAELAMRALWKEQAPDAGPALFRQGLAFAVGLTLLPIPMMGLTWLMRLAARIFGL